MHQQYTKIEFDEHLDVINNWLKELVHINDLYIVESFFFDFKQRYLVICTACFSNGSLAFIDGLSMPPKIQI